MKWVDLKYEFSKVLTRFFQETYSNQNYLLAVSGGVDSMVLLDLFMKFDLNFQIAHCNFGLRGKESDLDEELVYSLAKDKNIRCHVKKFNLDGKKDSNNSIQLLARNLRYEWFNELLEENNLDYLVTAHHANDNAETILFNLIRGTGYKGLMGIPSRTESIFRPLLEFQKVDIISYALKNKIAFRDDKSNFTSKYNRNKLRLEVIPIIEQINPQFCITLKENTAIFADIADIVESQVSLFKKDHCKKIDDYLTINFTEIMQKPGKLNILSCILEPYDFSKNQVQFLLNGNLKLSGTKIKSKTHELYLHGKEWVVAPPLKKIKPTKISFTNDCSITTPYGVIITENTNSAKNEEDNFHVYISMGNFKDESLVIRTRQEGDWIHLKGMNGKKQKLKDYFINEKLSIPAKDRQLLLCLENEVIWIVGKRKSERLSKMTSTDNYLKITFVK